MARTRTKGETVRVARCPIECGYGHEFVLAIDYEPVVGFTATLASPGEDHEIVVICPKKGKQFTITVMAPGKVIAWKVVAVRSNPIRRR